MSTDQKYWYENPIHPGSNDHYGKAINFLRLLCHSIIIKNPSPIRTQGMNVDERISFYSLLRQLSSGKEKHFADNCWEEDIITILKKIATELVEEQRFKSEELFFATLAASVQNFVDAAVDLRYFNMKVKTLYTGYSNSAHCA